MSRIAKIPVEIKEGVTVNIANRKIDVSGPKGNLSWEIPRQVKVDLSDGMLRFAAATEDEKTTALLGTARAVIANMVKGVSEGFEKKLELSGVGYRASVAGADLMVSVGFSHPVKITPPQGVSFQVEGNAIFVRGIDKVLVGDAAAKIRFIKPPEPYKGKGIKYAGERIRRKAGKAGKTGA